MTDTVASKIAEFKRKKSSETTSVDHPSLFEASNSGSSNNETMQRMLVKQKLKQNRELYRPVTALKQS